MNYENPIIRGFYPDPSICFANEKYYLVTSSMQYFPGIPIFESVDLINWRQIGNCITRFSQVNLDDANNSSGIFASTIRFYNGRFYVVSTNSTTGQHFIVYTDNVHSEWSDPIYVDQSGIDPSLLFENEKIYFVSNGMDDFGNYGIIQSEIDIFTGEKITPSKCIWTGTGGKFIEGPHLYHINDYYYLLAAEGGTEYGHTEVYARGKTPYGPFESYKNNPVLTNRNLGGYEIQGVGHGELIQGPDNNWYFIHLGFRQIDEWSAFHHLGREVFMTPVYFDKDQWFFIENEGTTKKTYNLTYEVNQKLKNLYTFENTDLNIDWVYIRHPNFNNYILKKDSFLLKGSSVSLNDAGSPTFIGLRQIDFDSLISCDVEIMNIEGEGGITIYMNENHHYDISLIKNRQDTKVIFRITIGDVVHKMKSMNLENNFAKLIIVSDRLFYHFYVNQVDPEHYLGGAKSKYLSSEVAEGFTGVIVGLYAYDAYEESQVKFTNFSCKYN